jgi:hypothetical protein
MIILHVIHKVVHWLDAIWGASISFTESLVFHKFDDAISLKDEFKLVVCPLINMHSSLFSFTFFPPQLPCETFSYGFPVFPFPAWLISGHQLCKKRMQGGMLMSRNSYFIFFTPLCMKNCNKMVKLRTLCKSSYQTWSHFLFWRTTKENILSNVNMYTGRTPGKD